MPANFSYPIVYPLGVLATGNHEFPMVNPRHGCRAHRYGYLVRGGEHRQHELLAAYEAIVRHLRDEHAGHPDLPYWLLTLDYGIRERRALIAWSDEALATLRTLARPDGRRRGKGTPKSRAAKNQDQPTATGGPRQ